MPTRHGKARALRKMRREFGPRRSAKRSGCVRAWVATVGRRGVSSCGACLGVVGKGGSSGGAARLPRLPARLPLAQCGPTGQRGQAGSARRPGIYPTGCAAGAAPLVLLVRPHPPTNDFQIFDHPRFSRRLNLPTRLSRTSRSCSSIQSSMLTNQSSARNSSRRRFR